MTNGNLYKVTFNDNELTKLHERDQISNSDGLAITAKLPNYVTASTLEEAVDKVKLFSNQYVILETVELVSINIKLI